MCLLLMREVGEARKERKKVKICTIYRIIVKSCKSQAFLSLTLREITTVVSLRLPSSEGAAKQEPLRLILTCSISTVPTSLRLRGRTPREVRPYSRIGKLSDKSEFAVVYGL